MQIRDINNFNSSNITPENNNEVKGVLTENNIEKPNTTNSTAIVAVENIKTDTTTLATVTIEENPMEKLLREKETKKVADEKELYTDCAIG